MAGEYLYIVSKLLFTLQALKTCEDSGAYDAKAFIYGRTVLCIAIIYLCIDCKGDPFEALKIMVYEGHDIEMVSIV